MKTKRLIAFWILLGILLGLFLSGIAMWYLSSHPENLPWTFLSGLAAAPSLILTWYWRTSHKERDLDNDAQRIQKEEQRLQNESQRLENESQRIWNEEQRLLSERFNKAVELLGHETLQIRLGGIYALERIAQDSERDHWTVMETLCAFVRERTRKPKLKPIAAPEDGGTSTGEEARKPAPKPEFELPDTDVQATLTVIGRREEKWRKHEKKKDNRLDLRGAHLE
ncbi:MAG: hypothetical protein HKP13_08460, partial [Gammaproteobacteria bacterium]|nr:hypothetical protein [Gammaproteobacteria bacterium]